MALEAIFPQGGANATIYIALTDTNGDAVTGLVASDLSAHYLRPRDASPTSISLTDLSNPDSTHSDGGFIEVDSTNMPGVYRLDLPDAVIARGENYAIVTLTGASIATAHGLVSLDPEPSVVQGSVNDTGASTTSFVTNLAESTNDIFVDAFCLFVNGANANAVEKITGYDGSTKALTTNAFPNAPADGDQFIIINR